MTITDHQALWSLQREAHRQANFYTRQNNHSLAEFWTWLENLAYAAQSGGGLIITAVDYETLPIKACEQVQQLRKPFEDQ